MTITYRANQDIKHLDRAQHWEGTSRVMQRRGFVGAKIQYTYGSIKITSRQIDQ